MTATFSLRKRLLVGLTLSITLLWIAAAVISGLVVQRQLDATFDNVLEETAQRILPLAILDIFNREGPATPQRIAPLKALHGSGQLTYLVRDDRGTILLQSRAADPDVFKITLTEGFATTSTHRIYTATGLRETILVQVAEPLAHRRAVALNAATALLVPLLFLIPISLFGTWLLIRLSLRGMLSYRRAIETRGAGDLSPISVAQLPVEIGPLVNAINRLMDRLRNALEAERTFTANSSHELRTPLAAILAQTQRLRREAPDGPLQARAALIEASVKDLSRLSEKLMQLAKAEGGGLLSETAQDLVGLLRLIVHDMRSTTSTPINLTLPETNTVVSAIDPDAFAILVRNLVENAVKHAAPGSAVEVALAANGTLRVVNSGPIVPVSLLSKLPARFVRGDSRTAGFGLGLTIAATIARGCGAEMTLASPAHGKPDGFEAAVRFSAAKEFFS